MLVDKRCPGYRVEKGMGNHARESLQGVTEDTKSEQISESLIRERGTLV